MTRRFFARPMTPGPRRRRRRRGDGRRATVLEDPAAEDSATEDSAAEDPAAETPPPSTPGEETGDLPADADLLEATTSTTKPGRANPPVPGSPPL